MMKVCLFPFDMVSWRSLGGLRMTAQLARTGKDKISIL